MSWFRPLRRAPSDATPTAPPVSRRRFAAGGVALASTLLADPSWAAVEARAAALGITPGTRVDAQGRPLSGASMGLEPFVGEVMLFGGNFAPLGWAFCDGQLLAVSENDALFSLLGTIYGGDGQTTFALPDLRGRVPIHAGTGSGLSPRVLGARGGQEQVTLTAVQLPAHDTLPEVQVRGTGPATVGATVGGNPGTPVAGSSAGGSQAHDNMPPVLAVNYCIALFGIYPSRN